MESYIVRIYRSKKNSPGNFVGIVEEVGVEEKKAFTNRDELWAILNSMKKRPERERPKMGHAGRRKLYGIQSAM